MKTLYIDCGMGAAGDMLTAALLEIACRADNTDESEALAAGFTERFNALGIPGVEMSAHKAVKQGITGTRVHITVNGEEEHEPDEHAHHHHHDHDHEHHCHTHEHDHDHDHDHDHHCHDHHEHSHDHDGGHTHDHDHHHAHVHRSMQDIEAVINGLDVDEEIKTDVLSIYHIIAEAEGKVHGKPAGEVHFHEVGTMDAVADVTAVCMLIHQLAPDKIVASPMATGYGKVRCAHGVLPVPAPATAIILQGVPAYAGDVEGELCTPTGAAVIKHFAGEYSQMPMMRTEAIGYGLGTKDFEKANCLRVFYGDSVD